MNIKPIPTPARLPERALIIDTPWIDFILRGEKLWEMRTSQTRIRGPIGLIRKGSGLVVGQARLTDSLPAQSFESLLQSLSKHRIPIEDLGSGKVAKWRYPWVLEAPQVYQKPVPYRHPPGAVIWVDLTKAI